MMPEALSVNAFAARLGVDEAAVRKGIKNGRLERSLGRDAKGRAVIIDVALAEQEWRTSRDTSKVRGKAPSTISEERRLLLQAQRRKVDLDVRRRRGELFDSRIAVQAWASLIGSFRSSLLTLPRAQAEELARASARGGPVAIEAVLMRAVRDCLTALSGWKPPEMIPHAEQEDTP